MFIRITLSAKIGKDYKSIELGSILKDDGTFSVDFPRDMDYSVPFPIICEPSLTYTDAVRMEKELIDAGFVYPKRISVGKHNNANSQRVTLLDDPALEAHTEKLLEQERKRHVTHWEGEEMEKSE